MYDKELAKKKTFREGEPTFQRYRDSLLRESDRYMFLAVSCFRRALDLLVPSALFWSHVSLYYCSWFAAHSILGMFGCWVRGIKKTGKIVVQVQVEAPGSQEFEIEKNYFSSEGGPHQFFWDVYYRAMSAVVVWTDPALNLAVSPVSGNPTWPIDRRNAINYQPMSALKLMDDHLPRIDEPTFPASLQGDIATQFQLAKAIMLFCADRAVEFGLRTDVHPNTRLVDIRDRIFRVTRTSFAKHAEESRLAV